MSSLNKTARTLNDDIALSWDLDLAMSLTPSFSAMLSAPSDAAPLGTSEKTAAVSTAVLPGQSLFPQGGGTPPAWLADLKDPNITTLMWGAFAPGYATEAGLGSVLMALASGLSAAGKTLSAVQFADLQTVANNCDGGHYTSSYVSYLLDATIDGNAANTLWTGGGTFPTFLGNLGINSTGTQLSELTEKWFMGSDLPSRAVTVLSNSFTVSYSADDQPLFAAGGPTMNDINQGALGDCYFEASMAEIAYQHPEIIRSMFEDNHNGTYGVKFYVNGSVDWVTVNNMLPDGGQQFNSCSNDDWASLAEKAYAQLVGGIPGNIYSWTSIGNGAAPDPVLEAVTGTFSQEVNFTYPYTPLPSPSDVLGEVVGALESGADVVLSSYGNHYDSSGNQTLVADHAMSVFGYDRATGGLLIRNPWGDFSSGYDVTFEADINTLAADGDSFAIDDNTNASSVVSGAAAIAAFQLQNEPSVTAFSIYDSYYNVEAAIVNHEPLAWDTKLTTIDIYDAPVLTLQGDQYATWEPLLPKIVGSTVNVVNATASQASTLQADTHVNAFQVSDTAANVLAAMPSLVQDSKLTALSVSASSGAYTIDLAGSAASASIHLSGNTAAANGGLSSPSLGFIGTPDEVTLGSGASTVTYDMRPNNGIEVISNFRFGLDKLLLSGVDAWMGDFHISDTTLNGVHAIAIRDNADAFHGVVLAGQPVGISALFVSSETLPYIGGARIG